MTQEQAHSAEDLTQRWFTEAVDDVDTDTDVDDVEDVDDPGAWPIGVEARWYALREAHKTIKQYAFKTPEQETDAILTTAARYANFLLYGEVLPEPAEPETDG